MHNWNDTAHKLLDSAESLIKVRGFNAFSFRDLQRQVGVKTSTIHYYFATKADLANAVLERFLLQHRQSLLSLESKQPSAIKRLQSIADFFVANSEKGEFCLGGMLSSELNALNLEAKKILADFFGHFEMWVEATIDLGKNNGEMDKSVNAKHSAQVFVAAIEGGMLITRVRHNSEPYKNLLAQIIKQIKVKGEPL